MVNIIIPTYNAHKTIKQAVASVAAQENQDNIKLTIVDDCSNEPYDYLLEQFKYLNIHILRKPFNSGCGQSRQYGIDHTDCEYFMFLDADDCLYTTDSVKKLLATIKYGSYDVVSSVFLEERTYGEEYTVHQNDFVWMHGKIYRTKHIKERNIRFNETRTNEDNAYNIIILSTGAKIYFADFATYIWKNNQASLTRTGDYLSDNINEFIINAEYAVSELIRLKTSAGNLLDCALQYLISLYGYYLIFLHQDKDNLFFDNFISNVQRYYTYIPAEFKDNQFKGHLEQVFYRNSAINIIISKKIIMNPSIYDFLSLINKK